MGGAEIGNFRGGEQKMAKKGAFKTNLSRSSLVVGPPLYFIDPLGGADDARHTAGLRGEAVGVVDPGQGLL